MSNININQIAINLILKEKNNELKNFIEENYNKITIDTLFLKTIIKNKKKDIYELLKLLINLKSGSESVISYLYERNILDRNILKFIIDYDNRINLSNFLVPFVKDKRIDLLKIIFEYYVYDRSFILNLLIIHKNKYSLSDKILKQIIFKEKNKININEFDVDGNTLLHIACFNGDKNITEYLLNHGAKITEKNKKGKTILYSACMAGEKYEDSLIQCLLDRGVDINETIYEAFDNVNNTVLFYVYENYMDEDLSYNISKFLIDNGIDIHKENERGETILFKACYYSSEKCVNYLVEHGADINKKNILGNTPLQCTFGSFYEEFDQNDCERLFKIIKYLIKHGADINNRNNDGETPLFWACNYCEDDIINYLIDNGADINILNNFGETLLISTYRYSAELFFDNDININYEHNNLKNLIAKGIDINKDDKKGKTLLHYACEYGDEKFIQWLIEKCNANVKKVDNDGKTPLHYLLLSNFEDDELIKLLIEHGTDINKEDNEGKTALFYLCEDYFLLEDRFKILLDYGADPNKEDKNGISPLIKVISRHNEDRFDEYYYDESKVIKILVEYGADVNKQNNKGQTPLLSFYIKYRNLLDFMEYDILYYLIEKGTNINQEDNEGKTILHYACCYDDEEFIQELIEKYNANVKKIDNNGRTPLHYLLYQDLIYIIINDCEKLVKLLLDHGADINKEDNEGITPFHYLLYFYGINENNIGKLIKYDKKKRKSFIDLTGNIYLNKLIKDNYKLFYNKYGKEKETKKYHNNNHYDKKNKTKRAVNNGENEKDRKIKRRRRR